MEQTELKGKKGNPCKAPGNERIPSHVMFPRFRLVERQYGGFDWSEYSARVILTNRGAQQRQTLLTANHKL